MLRVISVAVLLHIFHFSVSGFFWFYAGLFLRFHPIRIRIPKSLWCPLVIVSAILAWCSPVYKWGMLLNYISVPVWMLTLYWLMPCEKVYLRGYSFPIYLIHNILLGISRMVIVVLGIHLSSWLVIILYFVLAFSGSIGTVCLLRRYLPRFTRLAFGGR